MDRVSDGYELRFAEVRSEGRRLTGVAVPYSTPARIGEFTEQFMPGAFGDVRSLDVILNRQHDRRVPLARTGGGGLVLTDGPDALRMEATLPGTRDADDALELVRRGVLRGLSVEFRNLRDSWSGNLRTVHQARLGGIGLVDRPAYPTGVEARQRERTFLAGRYDFRSRRTVRDRGRDRKVEYLPGSMDFAIDDPDREIAVRLGRRGPVMASKQAGSLGLRAGKQFFDFVFPDAPSVSHIADFVSLLRAGQIRPGLDFVTRIPPSSVVPGAVQLIPEPGNPGVNIQQIGSAVLRSVAILAVQSPGVRSAVSMVSAGDLGGAMAAARKLFDSDFDKLAGKLIGLRNLPEVPERRSVAWRL